MKTLSKTIDITAPPDRVWQVMSDVDRWHEWTPSISNVTRLGNQPFAVGTTVAIVQPKLPPARWTVTSIEPGRVFEWTSRGPGYRVVGRHAVEPTAAGSRAILSIAYHGLLGAVIARMTWGITERYVGFEAEGLKARSENPAYRHSG